MSDPGAVVPFAADIVTKREGFLLVRRCVEIISDNLLGDPEAEPIPPCCACFNLSFRTDGQIIFDGAVDPTLLTEELAP